MKYTDLFTPHHLATLVDWLAEKGQLLVQIELPHSGGAGLSYTVRSMAELKAAIQQVSHPEIEIMIWKNISNAPVEAELPDLHWIYMHSDEVMYLAVKKNRNFNASYQDSPARYEKTIDDWFGQR
jgi:hypothetical protein